MPVAGNALQGSIGNDPVALVRRNHSLGCDPSPRRHHRGMTRCRISLPSQAMALSDEEFPIVAESLAVIEEAQDDGVYLFGEGIEESSAGAVLMPTRR